LSDNTDQFSNGSGSSIFGNPDVSSTDSPDDWKSWDWHQIEAAILGGAEMTTSAEAQTALGVSDPTTLRDAADTFYTVQTTLQAVADDLVHQANLLAGQDDSPWKGDAADAFVVMIKNFVGDIQANIAVLQDAAGNSLPDELINNANMLEWAQQEVAYIDDYYAQLASAQGADTKNGLVQVHEIPSIPPLMTADMMQVMSALVSNYQSNVYNSAVQPQVINPTPNSNLPNVPNANVPNADVPNVDVPNANVPNVDTPNINSPGTGNLPPADFATGPNLNTVPNLGASGPNLGAVPNLGASGPNLGAVPNLGTSVPSLGAVPNAGSVPNLNAGGPGVNALANLGAPPTLFTVPPNLGAGGLPIDEPVLSPNAITDDVGESPDLAGLPLSDDLPTSDVPDFGALNPMMDAALNPTSPTTPSLMSSDPAAEDAGLPFGEGLPMMPGAGSGAGAPSSLGEPSDASGLLGGTDPFSSSSSMPLVSDELGSPSGAVSRLANTDEAGLPFGEGLPMMPGAGSGAGAPSSLGEPSDASGLLGNEVEAWAEPASGALEEIGSPDGAKPVAGLAADGVPDEMPFMPEMGGVSQPGGAGREEERSDASGPLAGEELPWQESDEAITGEVGSADGAASARFAEPAFAGLPGVEAAPEVDSQVVSAESGNAQVESDARVQAGRSGGGEHEYAQTPGHQPAGSGEAVVVGVGGQDGLSGWDVAGAAADAALFTLGAWAARRHGGDEDDEAYADIVSSEQEAAWLGEGASLSEADDEADALLGGVSIWRPVRGALGSADGAQSYRGTLRSARPPQDYDPIAAAEAAAEAERAEARRVEAQDGEDDAKGQRSTADLLTQEPDMWGLPRRGWDEP